MGDSKNLGFIKKSLFSWILKVWLFMGLLAALFATVTCEDKVEAPSSGLFCISDCVTCPVICSPPPPSLLTPSYPPPSPHSPPPSYLTFSPPPSKSPPPPPPTPSSHSSPAPPPPLNSYTPPSSSGSAQPRPTVISGPHDYSYPYYYFYASNSSSLSIHAPFFVLLLFLIGYSIVGNQ